MSDNPLSREEILSGITQFYNTYGIENCNQCIESIADKFDNLAREADFEHSIKLSPLFFDEVEFDGATHYLPPLQLFELVFEDNNLTGAYVSDYRSGPPDAGVLEIDGVPDTILLNILNELTKNFT